MFVSAQPPPRRQGLGFIVQPLPVYVFCSPKDCAVPLEVNYGEKVSLVVPKEASVLEFTTPKSSDRWVLWSRINTDNTRGARGTVGSDLWVVLQITQADAGRYTFLRESGGEISSTALLVKGTPENT